MTRYSCSSMASDQKWSTGDAAASTPYCWCNSTWPQLALWPSANTMLRRVSGVSQPASDQPTVTTASVSNDAGINRRTRRV